METRSKYNAKPVDNEMNVDSEKLHSICSASEHAEQVALFNWAAYIPELKWMFAIPNGGKRQKAVAGKLKAEGVKSGVLDIFLPLARGGYHGLFIEMKSETGRLTPEQTEWILYLDAEGYAARVCHGCDEAIAVLTDYLALGVSR